MDYLWENVLGLLKRYQTEKKKIDLLRYERDSLSITSLEENRELLEQLERLERKVYRLEHYVEQLPDEQMKIIQGLYFKGKSQKVLVEELPLSESTLQRYRDKAVEALVKVYSPLQEVGIIFEW